MNDQYLVTNESLIQRVKQHILNMQDGDVSASAYDTAWVARIPANDATNGPMFPATLQWLIEHQLPDGSWGTEEVLCYHDRIICTLNTLITLKSWQVSSEQIQAGETYIHHNLSNLSRESFATVGFELILPTLIDEAHILGINLPYNHPILKATEQTRNRKLAKIPLDMIYKYPTTILHSLEGLGNSLDCQRILQHQSVNGSFLNSPSSTVFVYLKTGNLDCLRYIQELLSHFSDYVPVNYPLDIFEKLWIVNNIYFLRLEHYFQEEIDTFLSYVKAHTTSAGVPWSKYVQTPDIDDTAVFFKLLRLKGEQISSDILRNFYDGSGFFCFPGEMDTSVSHIMNLLEAARTCPKDEILLKAEVYSRNILINALNQVESNLTDKWLISDNLRDMVAHITYRSHYETAPWLEHQERLTLYRKLMYNRWIDKSVYFVPRINNPLLYELAYADTQESVALFKEELQQLQIWTGHYLTSNHAIRVLPTHFVACNIATHKDQQAARLVFSKITLWLFGTDDFFDADVINLSEVEVMAQSFLQDSPPSFEQINTLHKHIMLNLWHVINELIVQASVLQERDVRQRLYELLQANLQGGYDEALIRLQSIRPTFEHYMSYARQTIGVPLVLELTFYAMGTLAETVIKTPEYHDVIHLASDIIRVLNDVRSYEKELLEGKINSVGIQMYEHNWTKEEAVHFLLDIFVQKKMEELYTMALTPNGIPTDMKMLAFDLCRTTAWFYRHSDFHKYTAQMMMQVYTPPIPLENPAA